MTTTPAAPQPAATNPILELNTLLMDLTFLISGPSARAKDKQSIGTGFVISKPDGKGFSYYVLTTAAHVFDDIAGNQATINVRAKQPDGSYIVSDWPITLRENGRNIYVKHPSVDAAAIYIALPESYQRDVKNIGDALLASENDLKKYEVHPGDELFCLGYPLGAAGPFGFPILRSGKIASYPLTPTSLYSKWLFDFRVFGGNSGGPVYLIDRSRHYGNNINVGESLHMLVGLVTQQVYADEGMQNALQLGVIIPSTYVKATIDALPSKPPPSTLNSLRRPVAPQK